MVDDRSEEEKVEIEDKNKGRAPSTEEPRAAVGGPPPKRESTPPRATVPFKPLADPKSPEELVDDPYPVTPAEPPRRSFIPRVSDKPVIATPIQQVIDRERKRASKNPPPRKSRGSFGNNQKSFADEWKAVLTEDEAIMDLSKDMMVKEPDEPFPFQKEVLKKEAEKDRPSEQDDTIAAVTKAAEGLIAAEEASAGVKDAPDDADGGDQSALGLDQIDDEEPFELTAEADLASHLGDSAPEGAQTVTDDEGPTLETAFEPETELAPSSETGDDIPVIEEEDTPEVTETAPPEDGTVAEAAGPPRAAQEPAEDLTEEVAEDLTEDMIVEPKKSPENAASQSAPKEAASDDDDGEEIDLSEAEEMSVKPPAVPPEGRKPRIRRRKKHSMEWWARIFNDDYVSTIPRATVRGDQRKVNFIEKNLALSPNSLVLDLACGNGRHSVGMAKRGYRVVGIDLSLPMLAQAAELAQDENQNINFIHGDMRDLSFDRTFDGIFCMGTSFGYFDEESNFKVLQGVVRALKPGGSFLLEVANRDHVITQAPDLTWFEGNGSVCMEETAFDFMTSRLEVNRQLIMDGGRQVQNKVSIRLYALHELNELFQKAGLNILSVSGHGATQGAFFGKDSVRIMVSAKRTQ